MTTHDIINLGSLLVLLVGEHPTSKTSRLPDLEGHIVTSRYCDRHIGKSQSERRIITRIFVEVRLIC